MKMIVVLTHPERTMGETSTINALFEEGLSTLHLRKPDMSKESYEKLLREIYPKFLNRVVIHDHFELITKYKLKGIHLSTKKRDTLFQQKASSDIFTLIKQSDDIVVSTSAHSIEEIGIIEQNAAEIEIKFDYIFLSPVFDSISKIGYKKSFEEKILREKLPLIKTPIFALGGIEDKNIASLFDIGFKGAALLGYIWQDNPVARFNTITKPVAMSIAGFDPSSGAGITADIKAFEYAGVYGLGICSAITAQNATQFKQVKWTSFEEICTQIDMVNRPFEPLYSPEYVKIGIVKNLSTIYLLCEHLLDINPNTKIIWDPVIESSSGYTFHRDFSILSEVMKRVYLITPNSNEINMLFGSTDINFINNICENFKINILWKGGHNKDEDLSTDRLFYYDQHRDQARIKTFSVVRSQYHKHGTGCVLSAAITAFLSKNYPLEKACDLAQLYVSELMANNQSPLSFHTTIQKEISLSKPDIIKDISLQYITDPSEHISISEQIAAVCRGGIKMVQLRMKESSNQEILSQARMAKRICEHYNALLIINDNPIIARQINADGVHLGRSDMDPLEAREILGKNKIIGATCNTIEDIIENYAKHVDYIGVGPFRETSTKKNLAPQLSYDGYRQIYNKMKELHIDIPLFAIGGITEGHIADLMACGVSKFALSSTIKNSPDIELASTEIRSLIEKIIIQKYGFIKNSRQSI